MTNFDISELDELAAEAAADAEVRQAEVRQQELEEQRDDEEFEEQLDEETEEALPSTTPVPPEPLQGDVVFTGGDAAKLQSVLNENLQQLGAAAKRQESLERQLAAAVAAAETARNEEAAAKNLLQKLRDRHQQEARELAEQFALAEAVRLAHACLMTCGYRDGPQTRQFIADIAEQIGMGEKE